MEWIDVNLNDSIRFVLTEHGAAILAKQHNSFASRIKGWETRSGQYYIDKQKHNGGYTSMQMWCFMESFGEHIGMCKPTVIDRLTIQVNKS